MVVDGVVSDVVVDVLSVVVEVLALVVVVACTGCPLPRRYNADAATSRAISTNRTMTAPASAGRM